MNDVKFVNEPAQISIKDRVFIANGKKYYIADKICIDRWKEYEKLQIRLTFGIGFLEIFSNLTAAFELLNKQKFAQAAVVIHNVLSGIKDAETPERMPDALMMCALVMNREGEDVKVYDEQVALDKIEDWRAEGLDMLSFFAWALNSINGFKQTYISFIEELANKAMSTKEMVKE